MALQDSRVEALVPTVVGRMPNLLGEIRDALRPQWAEYADFLDANEADVTASAVAVVDRLISLVGNGGDRDLDRIVESGLFEEIGRKQWRDGKDLQDLLGAYRTGVRVFWRHVAAVALEVGVEPHTLAALAEAVFAFVDQLSSSSARGFVRQQGEDAANRERYRDELVTLLLSDRADAAEVHAAALRAGWTVPDEVAVVLVPPDDPDGRSALSHLDSTALPIRGPLLKGAIVPYPSRAGGASALRRMLRGTHATVGAAVDPQHLPASLHVAEIAARLRNEGLLDGDPVFAADHLDAIIVHRDARLLDVLRSDVLRPLANSPATSRERMLETLRVWLATMGDRQAMAAELHVHPQTVRYRLARLHELFGPALDDPATRARLTLALAWKR